MKKGMTAILLVLLCGLFSGLLSAAENGEKEKRTVFRLGLITAVGVETRIAGAFTASFYASPIYDFSEKEWGFGVGSQLRYYYNLERRRIRGRRVAKFAADYFGLEIRREFFSDIPDVLALSLNWGMQRNLGRIFYYGFGAGFGPCFKAHSTDLCGQVIISLGVAL